MSTDKIDKTTIKGVVEDLVGSLLYYDRKGCEDLPLGAIEAAIKAGELTPEEIIGWFTTTLTSVLK